MGSKAQGRNVAQHGSRNSFAGVKKKDLMLLNDLRWTAEMNLWYEFLNILEGQLVYLAEQKSHFDQDIILSGDINHFLQQVLK